MKTTIFKRMYKSYAVTLIIGFGLLSIILSKLFSNYFIEKKTDLLIQEGQKIANELYSPLYTMDVNGRFTNDLNTLEEFLDARIWIVTSDGTIRIISKTSDSSKDTSALGKKIDSNILKKLKMGTITKNQGHFNGMFKESVLSIGYPICDEDGDLQYAIILHASLPEVQKSFKDIYSLTIWAIIISGLLAYFILYVQVKKISTPLKEISDAAKIIAGGEFQKRLAINTGDEIEELGKSFNEMAESLEKIEEKRRNLMANISHDLRSPMTSIRGFIEGILDGTIEEKDQNHYLGVVLGESKRMIKMTNDILDLSKIQQGEININPVVFELNEVLRRVLISFEKVITTKELNIELSLCCESVNVLADKDYIERVVRNLLDNAIKFTPNKENILIATEEKGEKISVEIKNTGVTINTKELRLVWERFHKGDVSRGEHKTGFGLGLSIVREIIKQHKEKIWVESKNNYVKFSFTLQKNDNC